MSARALTAVLVRLWGVGLVLRVLLVIPGLIAFFVESSVAGSDGAMFRASQMGTLAGIVLTAAAGAILFRFADAIAARLVPSEDGTLATNIDASQLFLIALSLFALFLLVEGAERVVTAAYTLAGKPKWDETRTWEYVWSRHREAIPAALVDLAAGALLLVRRRTFAASLASRSQSSEA